jgi:hypothetical protein
MGANAAADQRQGISFFDYPQGLKVISHGCLLELFGDVDPSGTGSLARSGAFVGGELAQNAVRYRSERDDSLGAGTHAGTTAGTKVLVDYGQAVISHGESVKMTDTDA